MMIEDVLTTDLLQSWGLRGGRDGYQAGAIRALASNRRGILVAPPGSGKTRCAIHAIETLLRAKRRAEPVRILWVAGTVELLDQARGAFDLIPERFRSEAVAEFRCPTGCGDLDLGDVDLLVVDECHHAAAGSWAGIVKACVGARVCWGLTATPHRADGLWTDVEGLIGRIVFEVDARHIERVPAFVHMVPIGPPGALESVAKSSAEADLESKRKKAKRKLSAEDEDVYLRRKVYRHARKLGIEEHEGRNALVCQHACRLIEVGRSVLVLVATIAQGERIAAGIEGAELVHSTVTDREALIGDFREGRLRCLVATSLADEGFDSPIASGLVMACGGKGISKQADGGKRATVKLEQRVGRVLREAPGKESAVVVDFSDDHHWLLRYHSRQRVEAYEGQLGAVLASV